MTLHLIDASGIIHAAFHGYPPMARPSDDHPVGAVHGVCATLWRLVKQSPEHVAVVYDGKNNSAQRKALYPEYKANRPQVDPLLSAQFAMCRRAATAFGMAIVEIDGHEADDVIATYARIGAEFGHDVVIMSRDKDLQQLVTEQVKIFDPIKKMLIGPNEVRARWGIEPEQIADLLGLMGDVSDNIPGVPSVGIKTAAKLINQFGSIENILLNTAEISGKAVRASLEANRDVAILSKKLATLDQHVDTPENVGHLGYGGFDTRCAMEFMEEMEFVTLADQIRDTLSQMDMA